MTEKYDDIASLPKAFYLQAEKTPDLPVYFQAVVDANDAAGRERPKRSASYSKVEERVNKIAAYLTQLGVKKGDRIAIISQSRPEWMEADVAALAVGGVSVSVYQSLPWEDIGYILFDSGSTVVFAENQEQVDKLLHLAANSCEIPETEDRPAAKVNLKFEKIIAFEEVESHELVAQWGVICSGEKAAPPNQVENLKLDDLAALVYTSGTTGPPKGVMQSHRNHLANVRQVMDSDIIARDASIMLFLPLAHSFAKLVGYLGFLTPVQLYFPAIASSENSKLDPNSATKDIREAGAHVVPLVPRLLEKMQSGIQQKSKAGGLAGFLLSKCLWSAGEVFKASHSGKSASPLAGLTYKLTGFLRKKIKAQLFGSNFLFCISGGAKLGVDTAKFFDSLGIQILEGYGLTETCVATNVNRAELKKIGSVGPVLASDIELKFTDEKEIAYRGPNITLGYYNRPTATKEAWDEDGWFYTGDLGELDDKGRLSIVGRKKEILVSSYGKNIAPEPVEQLIKNSALVSQAVLLGDAKPFCAALITLDAPVVSKYGENPHENQEVIDSINAFISELNQDLPNHEKVRGFKIIPGDFTVENGFLTPTFKVKRKAVLAAYPDEVAGLYQNH